MGRVSAGMAWILGTSSIAFLIIIQMFLVPVLENKLFAKLLEIRPEFADKADLLATGWYVMLGILIFGIVLFMILSIFKREEFDNEFIN